MTFDGPELARNAANHTALSPVSILKRVERMHPELPAQGQALPGICALRK